MKACLVLAIALFLATLCGRAADSEREAKPVQMEPYRVDARPFGFLGIKHATVSLSPLKLIVGMNSVKFLQIDELEPGSPGVAPGVLPGDRIMRIDGDPITQIGLRKLKRMNRELEVGRKLRVEILRPSDGSTRTIEVTVPPRVQTPSSSGNTSPRATGADQPR